MSIVPLAQKRCSRVKKYACEHPHCRRKNPPVRFAFTRDLRRHKATHDVDHGSKEKCIYCQDNRSRRIDNLMRHVKTQHRGGILKAVYDGDKETFAWCIANYPGCINVIGARHVSPGEEAAWLYTKVGEVTGFRILSRALEWEDWDMVRFLLDCGVDINAGLGGATALHNAVSTSNPFTEKRLDILKLLLARGADRQVLSLSRKTAFDVAREKQAEGDPSPFLLEAIELLRPKVEDQSPVNEEHLPPLA
ncbi:hypothetical protein QBC37DRAFT_386542 [Rhypophila decipiens]|uniref:Uncharacterized protein n=1 Tax=Rhypophila decipiens TaxID=261697 RepID=A0AAN6Y9Y7_9PEZI|nr:hypothetical protein QBC37DRAFT_386542 [Rhypophila decipiens]